MSERQPFQEAVDFLKQKIALPSKTWRDLAGNAHDRGLVVAGAMQQALIEDFAAAIRQFPQGMDPVTWQAEFERIVKKHGWTGWTGEETEAGRAWRARVIYDTNLKTASAAGRYKQMTDPDVLKRRPFWRYIHGYERTPEVPRDEHLALDGKVFRADDPIWDKIYPPNGWNCSCGVEPLDDEELAEWRQRQRQRDQGGTYPDGPDTAPVLETEMVYDRALGQKVPKTKGIDFGWDHAPGQNWARGIVPQEMQHPLPPPIRANRPPATPPLADFAKPFTSARLPEGWTDEQYIDAFLQTFGGARGRTTMFRDASGHALPINDDLFRRPDGTLKLNKHGQARGPDLARLAEAILDPDEIWIDWGQGPGGKWRLVRRYLRQDMDGPGYASFAMWDDGWHGATAFSPATGRRLAPNPAYLEHQRQGALLWRRSK